MPEDVVWQRVSLTAPAPSGNSVPVLSFEVPADSGPDSAAFGWQIRYTLIRDGADSIFAVAVAEAPESERSLS